MKISSNIMASQISPSFSGKHHSASASSLQDATNTLGSKAVEVSISRNGKALSAASRLQADHETGAESSLNEIKAGKEQTARDKDRIAEIDDTLAKDDGRLTDGDRSALQKERAELEKRSKTPEDLMHEKYQQVRALEKKEAAGNLTGEDLGEVAGQIRFLNDEICKQKEAVQRQGKNEEDLMRQAVQERVAQDDKTNRTLAQESERQQAGEALQPDVLSSAADSESQKKALDVLLKPQDAE